MLYWIFASVFLGFMSAWAASLIGGYPPLWAALTYSAVMTIVAAFRRPPYLYRRADDPVASREIAPVLRAENGLLKQRLEQVKEEFEAWKRDEAHATHALRLIGREIGAGKEGS